MSLNVPVLVFGEQASSVGMTTYTTTGTFTPQPGSGYSVHVTLFGGTNGLNAVGALLGGGYTWSLVGLVSRTTTSPQRYTMVFVAVTPFLGSLSALQYNRGNGTDNFDNIAISVVRTPNVRQQSPVFAGIATNKDDPGNFTLAVAYANAPNEVAISQFAMWDALCNPTQGSGWTQLDVQTISGTLGHTVAYKNTQDTGETITWDNANSQAGLIFGWLDPLPPRSMMVGQAVMRGSTF